MINLDRSPDRLARITQQLAGLHLAFERIPAIDGATLSEAALRAFFEDRIDNNPLTPAEIGCLLSHVEVWRRVSSGAGWSLVLEDDVDIAPELKGFLVALESTEVEADLIKIETMGQKIELARKSTPCGGAMLHELRSMHFGTAGYLISPAGAKMLLKATSRVGKQADWIFDRSVPALAPLRVLQTWPALVIQQRSLFPSLITPFKQPRRRKTPADRAAQIGKQFRVQILSFVRGSIRRRVPYSGGDPATSAERDERALSA